MISVNVGVLWIFGNTIDLSFPLVNIVEQDP